MAQKKSYNRWWLILTIALISVPVLLFFGFGGFVGGEEFSPDDFTRREFRYNVMPLFKITLRGIQYEDTTPVFEQSLFSDGLIGKARPVKQWDLVSDYRSDPDSPDFDAGLLCNVLDISDSNNESVWIKWNEDHPELAKKFWPIVADLARRGLYIELSSIMIKGIGLQKEGRDKYLEFVNESSTNSLNRLGDQRLAEGEIEEALATFSRSIEISPTKNAYLGRAKCYRSLGDATKGENDEQSAETIVE